ncbi:hypothetical protein BDN71DRAFT_1510409 [Pleurotus eryngii]|uniref:Uncharacterized protein n=1 Tax=Pleurotus eryngii TaxID=5323 RepID=A0A9P5ZQP3_PLEER|nr:hypothetical protein BDN71DRAFT_1510409 [Pleurotus eryngii]
MKARSSGKPWTTDEQREYLHEKVGMYHALSQAHSQGGMKKFWAALYEEFLGCWPVANDLEVEAHNDAVKKQKNICVHRVFIFVKKWLAEWQGYSRLYFKSKIKKIVKEHWAKHEDYDSENPKILMPFRNAVTQELWKEASKDKDLKEEVLNFIEELYKRDPYTASDIDSDDEEEIDKEEKEQ